MEKKIKLSEKQKEVISEMRNGFQLKQNTVASIGEFLISNNGRSASLVRATTARFLIDNKIVEQTKKEFPFYYFTLTDLGKTIEL